MLSVIFKVLNFLKELYTRPAEINTAKRMKDNHYCTDNKRENDNLFNSQFVQLKG